jgi:hypothetical protein
MNLGHFPVDGFTLLTTTQQREEVLFQRGLGSGMHSVASRHHAVIASQDSDVQMPVVAEFGGQCC